MILFYFVFFFFSSRRRHTRWNCDWSSDVCSSDLHEVWVNPQIKRASLPRRRHSAFGFLPRRKRARLQARPLQILNRVFRDRKSTRLNSSHSSISYAVFCLKKKKKKKIKTNNKNH